MKRAALTMLAVLLSCGSALADGAEDGNRGLQAMQSGDYDGAIRDFTHAIQYGGLSDEDKEFAYANRGQAYLKKSDYSSAIADLSYACQVKPDDGDAEQALQLALRTEIPPDTIPNKPKISFWHALGNAVVQGIQQGAQQSMQQNQQ